MPANIDPHRIEVTAEGCAGGVPASGDSVCRAPSTVAHSMHHGRFGAPISVAVFVVFVLALYWQTTMSMASVWQHSATFTHGYVVVPIFLYLVWRQREALAAIQPVPCYPALLGIVVAGAIWLAGELVNVASVAQFAMIAMIPFAVWATLGTRFVKAIGIPLGFLFFAVPFGDFLVPPLMDRTADFTVAALRASGIPVFREGNYFTIPSGSWSVVEACSGVRYLIASFMVGSLFAYLSYRSPARRMAFIAASLAVPIVANWLRAYMIVMLGHLTNNVLAIGADHLIYGWIFFGIVMALLFWIGSRWRQDEDPVSASTHANATRSVEAQPIRGSWRAALAAIVLILVWQPLVAWLVQEGSGGVVQLNRIESQGGWVAMSTEVSAWRPDISHARTELRQSFERDGAPVGLEIAFYRNQSRDGKAITSNNQLVLTSNERWKKGYDGTVAVDAGGESVRARTAIVFGERERLMVWQWFWVDGRVTSSEYVAKAYQLLSVVQGHGDPVAWVVAYTPIADGAEARAGSTLRAFTIDMWGPIDAELRHAAAE